MLRKIPPASSSPNLNAQLSRKYACAFSSARNVCEFAPKPGTLFPIASSARPYTLGSACRSPHLFSMRGDTAAEAPLGQKIFDPSSFIGAISRSCCRSWRAFEYLTSVAVRWMGLICNK